TDRLAAGVAVRPRAATGEGEGADPGQRRTRRRTAPDAADGRGEGVPLRGTERAGEPARPLRGTAPVDRLPLLLRARRRRLAPERLPRLLLHGRRSLQPRAPERARHHLRAGLPCSPGRYRALPGADGLGDALVHARR